MVNGGQEDVQRQQQNGQEKETICGLIGGLASNPLQRLPLLLASLSLRGATGATTPPPKNGKGRKGTMVKVRTRRTPRTDGWMGGALKTHVRSLTAEAGNRSHPSSPHHRLSLDNSA